jgi:hypothetical protein
VFRGQLQDKWLGSVAEVSDAIEPRILGEVQQIPRGELDESQRAVGMREDSIVKGTAIGLHILVRSRRDVDSHGGRCVQHEENRSMDSLIVGGKSN